MAYGIYAMSLKHGPFHDQLQGSSLLKGCDPYSLFSFISDIPFPIMT